MNHTVHSPHAKAAYFNEIANSWDSWESQDPSAFGQLMQGISDLKMGADEIVVDVGCGTGNLTLALLRQLSLKGRVIGIDIASQMIDIARRKAMDERAIWHVADAAHLPLPSDSVDRVICFSVWPHFDDPLTCAKEFSRVLLPRGQLHIWHLLPRERVNAIHASAGEAVREDVLHSGSDVAALLNRAGFAVQAIVDNDESYLVTAEKPAA